MKRIYVIGTADTKGEELAFLADAVDRATVTPRGCGRMQLHTFDVRRRSAAS